MYLVIIDKNNNFYDCLGQQKCCIFTTPDIFDNKWCLCYTVFSFNKTEFFMSNTEYTLMDVVSELSNIEQALLVQPKNSFGESIGDELHGIQWKLERIADALEDIAKKMSH
jgi:predicted transcriptional regulator